MWSQRLIVQGKNARVTLTWNDNSTNETGFTIQRATNAAFTAGLVTSTVGANVQTWSSGNVARNTPYYFRVIGDQRCGAICPSERCTVPHYHTVSSTAASGREDPSPDVAREQGFRGKVR